MLYNFSFLFLQALNAHRAQFDRGMNIHSQDISDEQFQNLLKEHQQQQAQLATEFDAQKEQLWKEKKQMVNENISKSSHLSKYIEYILIDTHLKILFLFIFIAQRSSYGSEKFIERTAICRCIICITETKRTTRCSPSKTDQTSRIQCT